MTPQGELSWEEAACFTLQKSEKLFSSADEILQSIITNKLKNNCAGVDRRALEAILLCFSRGSSCKLVASSRKLNGHSRETLRFALKEEMDSQMYHFVDVELTDAELELIKLNGIIAESSLQREKTRKSLCVIRAPYSIQHLEKKLPARSKSNHNSNGLPNGHVKPPAPKTVKQPVIQCPVIENKAEKSPVLVNNPNSRHFHLLQSPNSPLVTSSLKNLVNETVFDELPAHIQDELLAHLPDCDESVSALLNNEFFSSALETFRNHLADGLFQANNFCETAIAPDKEPPPKFTDIIKEDEHYNITSVSPTKIIIAKGYTDGSGNKASKSKDLALCGNYKPSASSRRHARRRQLQNERVAALKKPAARSRRNGADSKPSTSTATISEAHRTALQHRYSRPIPSTLKTKSTQQAILHNLQVKQNCLESKAKKTTGPGGKPSVRFTTPSSSLCLKSTGSWASVEPSSSSGNLTGHTKTLASVKVVRKRKVASFSPNNLWLPQTVVHNEWIDISDDDEMDFMDSPQVPTVAATSFSVSPPNDTIAKSPHVIEGKVRNNSLEPLEADELKAAMNHNTQKSPPERSVAHSLNLTDPIRITESGATIFTVPVTKSSDSLTGANITIDETVVAKSSISNGPPCTLPQLISLTPCRAPLNEGVEVGLLQSGKKSSGSRIDCNGLQSEQSHNSTSDHKSEELHKEKASNESTKHHSVLINGEVHDGQAANKDGKCEPMDHVVSQDPKSDPKETILSKNGELPESETAAHLENKTSVKDLKNTTNSAVVSSINCKSDIVIVDVNCIDSSNSSKYIPTLPALTDCNSCSSSSPEALSTMSQSISTTKKTVATENNNHSSSSSVSARSQRLSTRNLNSLSAVSSMQFRDTTEVLLSAGASFDAGSQNSSNFANN